MVWPMIAAAAISLVGGAMQGRGAAKESDKQIAANKDIARIQGREARRTSAYQAELADYYTQVERQRNRDARFAMYSKYSKVPVPGGYAAPNIVPDKPVDKESSDVG